MTALSFGTPHLMDVENRFDWAEEGALSTRRACYGISVETPTPDSGNYAMRMGYGFDSMSPGASKTVKFNIGRM
jgi:hypothetical protein